MLKKISYLLCIGMTFCFLISNVEAKEKTLNLIIENQTPYPISVQYEVSRPEYVYATDIIEEIPIDIEHRVIVNHVGDGYTPATHLVPSIQNGNLTIHGGPCSEYFRKNQMRVIIRYKGDLATGDFSCEFSFT